MSASCQRRRNLKGEGYRRVNARLGDPRSDLALTRQSDFTL
ncbi:hypothetical protein [Candidatus Regiella endosymbiont of Tuberolachnus salignus]